MVLLNSGFVDLGTAMPDFALPDTVSGKTISNKDIDKEIVVIAFICNHCPYVLRIIKDFSALARNSFSTVGLFRNVQEQGLREAPQGLVRSLLVINEDEHNAAIGHSGTSLVSFIAISANDPDYRTEDSPENMVKFAKEHNFNFPYLFDETQEVARKFNAVCTPDIFVYKKRTGVGTGLDLSSPSLEGANYKQKNFLLSYHARFEDLEKAISELVSVGEVNFEQLPSIGCSIKWKSKNLP